SEALTTLVVNRLRHTLRVCAVKAPGYGEERRNPLIDLASMCGGEPALPETGGRLADVTPHSLGRAKHVSGGRATTLIREGGGAVAAVQSRARELRCQIEASSDEPESGPLRQRLARLAGGVAVLRIGAATELELHEAMARVEDAIQATRAAAAEGV